MALTDQEIEQVAAWAEEYPAGLTIYSWGTSKRLRDILIEKLPKVPAEVCAAYG